MSQPVVLIAEELSPATIDALGPEFEVRRADGSSRPELLAALPDVDAVLKSVDFAECKRLAELALDSRGADEARTAVRAELPILEELGL